MADNDCYWEGIAEYGSQLYLEVHDNFLVGTAKEELAEAANELFHNGT